MPLSLQLLNPSYDCSPCIPRNESCGTVKIYVLHSRAIEALELAQHIEHGQPEGMVPVYWRSEEVSLSQNDVS